MGKIHLGGLCIMLLLFFGCDTIHTTSAKAFTSQTQFALQFKQRWQVAIGNGTKGTDLNFSPLVAGKQIYVVDQDGVVTSISFESGKRLWQQQLPEKPSTSLAFGYDTLYVIGENAMLYALHRVSGRMVWQRALSNQSFVTPVVSNGLIFVKTIDDQLEAFSAMGQAIWHYRRNSPSEVVMREGGMPSVAQERVIAGFSDGSLVALNSDSGQIIWEQTLGFPNGGDDIEDMAAVHASPLIVGNRVFAVSMQGEVRALKLYGGELIWNYDLAVNNNLAKAPGLIFVTDLQNQIWGFEQEDGTVEWRQKQFAHLKLTAPVVLGQHVIVASEAGELISLALADGHVEAQATLPGHIHSAPVIAEGHILVLTREGTVYEFSLLPS